MNVAEFTQFYRHVCHFDRSLGMSLAVDSPGVIEYRLAVQEQHLSFPGSCHGGVLAAMMDGVLGLTALSQVYLAGNLCQTIEFKINYLSNPAAGHKLRGTGEIEYSGSSIVVTSGEIFNQSTQKLAAKAMGTFSVYPAAKREAELTAALNNARTAYDAPPPAEP